LKENPAGVPAHYIQCPNCRAYIDPERVINCPNCGVDVSLAPEEAAKNRLDDITLAESLKSLQSKSRLMKILLCICTILIVICFYINPWIAAIPLIGAVIFGLQMNKANLEAKQVRADSVRFPRRMEYRGPAVDVRPNTTAVPAAPPTLAEVKIHIFAEQRSVERLHNGVVIHGG